MSYYEKSEGFKFNELVDDPEVQKDLVRFFTGSRYKYSMDEIKELGPQGLADKFIDHMRYQETNEMTVAKDLYFAKSAKEEDPEGLQAFGRLMMAWDNSEGAGTGILDGAADYFMAFATSPSTIATVATAGLGGPVSKVISGGAKKAGQLTLRQTLLDGLVKETAKGVVRDKVAANAIKESMKKAAVKGAVRGAAIEGAIGGGMAYGQEDVREEAVEGYEKDMGKVVAATALSSAIGGGLGAFARTQSIKKQNQAIDLLAGQTARIKKSELLAAKEAEKALGEAKKAAKGTPKSKEFEALQKRTTTLVELLKKKEAGKVSKFKKALDEDMVEAGKEVASKVFGDTGDEFVTARFTAGTMKRVAAATLEVSEKLKFNLADDVRISQKVSDALRSGQISSSDLTSIRKKYGLGRGDFSLMFLSDMSEAGRTLNIASQISKGLSKDQAEEAAKRATLDIKSVLDNLDSFAREGITSPADESLADMARQLTSGNVVGALREADSFRIGMMTTQLATTMANVGSSIGRIGTDMSDQFFLNLVQGKNPFRGTLDVVKGLTWGKEEAHVARILAEMDPESPIAKMFHDVSRVETETGSSSILSRTVRLFNFANNLIDTQFKEAVMYSSLQRQIRDSGDSALKGTFDNFLRKGTGLEALPPEMVEKARRDALSFSYQWGYEGSEDWFGKGARGLITANKKYPFLISAGAGIPFPRFLANQIQYVHRHMPTGLANGLWEKVTGQASTTMFSTNEKIAQGMTGSLLLLGAIGMRLQADEDTNYDELIDPTSGDTINIKRAFGPYLPHLFVGDLIAKKMKGIESPKSSFENANEVLEMLTSLSTYGYGNPTLDILRNYAETGEINEAGNKWLGDIVASLTMPAATLRDVQAQFNPASAPSPYTRDLNLDAGDDGEGSGIFSSQLMQRALRFLPDYEWTQIAASFNGKTDIPLYDGFSSEPVMKVNPISSQLFGVDTKPKRNALETEMLKLNIKPYQIIGSKTFKNPNVDVVVRELSSKSLPQAFEAWREDYRYNKTVPYNELPVDLQKQELEIFLKNFVGKIEDDVEDRWQKFARDKPRSAAGYIVNNYAIQKKQYETELGGLTKVMQWGGIDLSEEEYLDNAESIEERLSRMQNILKWGAQLEHFEKRGRE